MEQQRIPSTNDLAFKKTFSSEQHKNIIVGFVGDFLGIHVDESDISIDNPYSIKSYMELLDTDIFDTKSVESKTRILKLRQTIHDISMSIKSSDVIIELQVRKERYFSKRSLYYAYDKYCSHYNEGDGNSRYSWLCPVYSINILGYNHFKGDKAFHYFRLYDKKNEEALDSESVEVCYFELKKQNTDTERQRNWQEYFLTGVVPDDAPDYLKDAAEMLKYMNLDTEERKVVDLTEKALATWEYDLDSARYEGEEKGRLEGRREGEESGLIKGAYKIARNALAEGASVTFISKITGLDVDTIQGLARTLNHG
jgi:predicted transposase/invertase (TIGR01784 family)